MGKKRGKSAEGVERVCPRCGYDLAGQAAAANVGACEELLATDDRRGVCSECGLGFLWVDVVDPTRHRLPWLVEHPPTSASVTNRRGGYLCRAAATWVRVLVPWRFWSNVRLETAFSGLRLALWPVALILPIQLVWSVMMGVVRLKYLADTAGGKLPRWNAEYTRYMLDAVATPIGRVHNAGSNLTFGLARPSASTAIPLGISVMMPVLLLVLSRSRAASRVRARHVLRAGVYGLAWTVVWYLAGACRTFMALGQELGSWWPLPRVGMRPMSVTIPALGVKGSSVLSAPVVVPVSVLAGAVWGVWLGLWWWFALRRGLRMEQAWLVWVLLMIAAVVFGLIVAMVDPRFVQVIAGL